MFFILCTTKMSQGLSIYCNSSHIVSDLNGETLYLSYNEYDTLTKICLCANYHIG